MAIVVDYSHIFNVSNYALGRCKILDTYSRHCILELWGCHEAFLVDRHFIEKVMVNVALETGAEVRETTFHAFTPQGVSGVVIISESHLSIHTFPEHGYAGVDIFTCGNEIDPKEAAHLISKRLGAKKIYELNMERGVGEILIKREYKVEF